MNFRKEKIVIIGFGWVGQANAISLKRFGYNVSYFDTHEPDLKYDNEYSSDYEKISRLKNIKEKDGKDTWYIVCVGDYVLESGEQDISSIEKALKSLEEVSGRIILRSTILPDKLKDLKFDFYVPEFLHEKKAVKESLKPQYYIVGIKNHKIPQPSFLNLWEGLATKSFKGTPEDAAYIKYLSNIWNAMRIAFINEIGNVITLPTDKDELGRIENIVDFFFERKSYLRYGRSYGGHCLPKDVHAFFTFYKNNDKNVLLIESVHISNLNHRKIEEKYVNLPEWFSEWVRPQMSGKVALRALGVSIKARIKKIFY